MADSHMARKRKELWAVGSKYRDVFFSYARIDNKRGLVTNIVEAVTDAFEVKTGERLRYFLDATDIVTAALWENTIEMELRRSTFLFAMLSPSYFKSHWCRQEWFAFEYREQSIGSPKPPGFPGLIIPVQIHSLSRGRFDEEERILLERARKRQWCELVQVSPRSVAFFRRVDGVAEDLADLLETARVAVGEEETVDTVILDPTSGLEWAGTVPQVQMTLDEAKAYVRGLTLNGHTDWRLPIVEELRSLLEHPLVSMDPESSPVPLRPPFNSPRYGYLHSGTPIQNGEGHYIMNIRNGHIFNGLDYYGYVRAVRGGTKPR